MTAAIPDDALHWRRALTAGGLLGAFNDAGVLDVADVHVATRVAAQAGEGSEAVALALALAVRALRSGSVCVDLRAVAAELDDPERPQLSWPDPEAWLAELQDSPLVNEHTVLRLYQDRLVYLDRYWREEEQVCADLLADRKSPPAIDEAALHSGLERVFHRSGSDEQRQAVRIALAQWVTVLTGGPGTGKTTTIAGLLALLTEQAEIGGRPHPRIALAAPTGKASARLQEAVRLEIDNLIEEDQRRLTGLQAVTLHRLLGSRPNTSARFKHHRGNRLPHDVVVVDETSMVSLTMMARLLEAVRPDARLILVGDPDQLASVEAGAVLADLVEGLGAREDTSIAELTASHRFGVSIGKLAQAIRVGDADQVLTMLGAGGDHIEFIEDPSSLRNVLLPNALQIREAAAAGAATAALAALDRHRLLCAHREGPSGVRHWNHQVERWLAEETGESLWSQWYLGRPVLVTTNDYGLNLYNGDTGVTILAEGRLRVAIAGAERVQDFATSRLADVETMHAMTIHKSQGGQADEITVLLPPQDSRLLTRELFYTAVTRAKNKVRIVGTEAEVRAALERRVVRASGLSMRLAGS